MTFDIRNEPPLVSVCLITYNHAPYIRDCLDSLLMQQTAFPFEICIGEDESTDGTREICVEYAEKHPDCIRLILRSQSAPERDAYEAQGNYNYVKTLKACRGTYIADCDGDDAWLDPRKLQKQVDVLESDPSLCLICSDYAIQHAETEEFLSQHYCRDTGLSHEIPNDRKSFMYNVLKSDFKISSSTTLMRRSAVWQVLENAPQLFMKFANGDTPLYCELSALGSFAYVDEPLAVHKVLPESATHSLDPGKRLRFYNRNEDMKLHLARKYDLPQESILRQKIETANRLALVEGDRTEIGQLYREHKRAFPLLEWLVFHLAAIPPMRALICHLYKCIYNARWKAV